MADPLDDDLKLMVKAATKGAKMAMKTYRQDPYWRKKDGGEPVSETDFKIDTYLREHFAKKRPGYGWLSEETADDLGRLDKERCIIVDPIDGTRAFLAGVPEFCVCIGLVEAGEPIAGVLAAPALERLYTARRGGGAFLDGERLQISAAASVQTAQLYCSAQLAKRVGLKTQARGPGLSSALAVARVAEGSADGVVVLSERSEWDLAAAAAILREAGGVLLDRRGQAWTFNTERPRRAGMLAGSEPLLRDVLAQIGS